MKGLLAKKIGMTQVFNSDGILIPVTVVQAEPNVVLAVKSKDKDGYNATQLGFKSISPKNVTKALQGHFKKANTTPKRFISEIREMTGHNVGDQINVSLFEVGEIIDVEGITRGHGFTGAIKRWNMKVGPMSHGSGFPHRFQGSLGGGRGGASAQHVFKGKHMSGHYGVEAVTVENLVVMSVDLEKNLLLIKGGIPGPKGSQVKILTSQKHPNVKVPVKLVDIKLESRKNELFEEAKHYSITLNLDMKLSEMELLVKNGKLAKEKQEQEKAAVEAAAKEQAARERQEQEKAASEAKEQSAEPKKDNEDNK